jgi:hypothetical protein
MEGFTSGAANNVRTMDSKGAQILARRLALRHGPTPATDVPAKVHDPSAAPIFRWFGIEPPRPMPPVKPAAE